MMIRCTAVQGGVGAQSITDIPTPSFTSTHTRPPLPITRRNLGILSLAAFTSFDWQPGTSVLQLCTTLHWSNITATTHHTHTAHAAGAPSVQVDALPDIDTRNLTSLQAAMVTQAVPENPGVSFALTKKQKQLFYPAWLEVCGGGLCACCMCYVASGFNT